MTPRRPAPGRASRRAHTLIEMLLVFALSSVCLGLLYQLFFSGRLRGAGVLRRIEGEQAVRILLARVRQELRHAVRPIHISQFGTSMFAIPLMDPAGSDDDPSNPRFYFSRYTFDRDKKQILFEKVAGLDPESGDVLQSRIWMGGDTPVHDILVEHTSDNNRILFQYYRVIIRVSYYDIRIKDRGKTVDENGEPTNLIHVSTTVYPRRINHELRIEVPQEGSLL